MRRVCGLQIADDRMAGIAKRLLLAHAVIIVIGLLTGVLESIKHFALVAAVADLEAKSGESDSSPISSGGSTVILNIAVPLALPTLAFFLARAGLQGNNSSILQAICMMDGCCTCCTGWAVVSSILSFMLMLSQKTWVEGITCNENGYSHRDGSSGSGSVMDEQEPYSQEECQRAKDALVSTLELFAVVSIIVALLSLCEVFACVFGTMKSNEAYQSLSQDKVFCGPPPPLQMQNGQVGQNGIVMVVGQPVGSGGMTIGQPAFSMGSPTAEGGKGADDTTNNNPALQGRVVQS
mmetsp:Transcript_48214/g.138451  ORF Transcript_48214/g.138451 Transcript_48214/m.138451 type:complete len:293 (+) Transcript_48214:93-971(+)